jgi:3-phenylpropionate/cinnamic acid dioxygenase small subunit
MSTDRADIRDLLIRYTTALDTRDWQLFDSCFTEDAVADYGTLGGHQHGIEAIRKAVAILAGFDRTQHFLGNITIAVDADEARTTCYLNAQHVIDSGGGVELLTVGGIHRDRMLRTPTGWRIAYRQLEPVWQSGNSDLINLAAQRAGITGAA